MTSCTCLCIWARVCEKALFALIRTEAFVLRSFFMHGGRGLSRKAPSNARGDDPFLGGFFFGFFRPATEGRSRKSASHRPLQAFCFLRGPAFLLCGNLLSLDRGNDCARPFIFPGWCVPSGSRSDRAGPGLGRGCGDGNPATLSEGGIQPQHISKPGSKGRGYARSGRKPTQRI